MAQLAPEADNISSEITDTIQFRDCGCNLQSIRCAACDAEIAQEWWSEQMGHAFQKDIGFVLKPVCLPCGHVADSLNELRYDFDQGFSRFIIFGMNLNIGLLNPIQVSRFEEILDCPVKIIYRHL